MTINDQHLLQEAKLRPLKHSSDISPEYIVVHNSAGGTASSTITHLKRVGFSYHILIDRDGTVFQCVPFNRRASHAGKSNWKGQFWKDGRNRDNSSLNYSSIGISLANYGSLVPDSVGRLRGFNATGRLIAPENIHHADHANGDPNLRAQAWEKYTSIQLKTLRKICQALVKRYPIKNILGHDEIAIGRKKDPGPAINLITFRDLVDLDRDRLHFHTVVNVAADDTLNVRSWRHHKSNKVAELRPGENVVLLSQTYKGKTPSSWVAISRDGIHLLGYVNKKFLKRIQTPPKPQPVVFNPDPLGEVHA